MRTLYCHVGWRKTGSSAIQALVTENLNDDMFGDLCFPPVGIMRQRNVFGGQEPLAHHYLGRLDREDQAAQAWEKLAEYVSTSGHDRFLISTEALSGKIEVHGKYTSQLRARLKVFDRVVYLIWLRRQDEYMASMYAQILKEGLRPRERHFPIGPLPDAYYHFLLKRFQATHPNAELRIFLYDDKGPRVLDQFINACEVERSRISSTLPARINARVTPSLYRLQGLVNYAAQARGLNAMDIQIPLIRAADMARVHETEPMAAVPLTHKNRAWCERRYARSNDRLCAAFDLDPKYFRLSKDDWETVPEYNIPDIVPVDFIDGVLAGLDKIRTKPGSPYPEALRDILRDARERQDIRLEGGIQLQHAMNGKDAGSGP